ncbi:ferric-dicitrate binding protein FerR (iron transport regulator) [Dysgonomonas hofstadii]|uniref:Ferric-dicitrate binding protein FerR (Iron transport regulator) n=1 Tax=Dysgonomonas hofstadii TaxID=637886 RepID=A0A840CPB7_9BACT|nr:FecR domain-containing protein [Dysgonomonas hofstadii]MBB4034815.1 ferric-dicitrate binding protein FerR (iron transport regulator) [Dysgonomonas hofstadii]
MRGKLLKQLDIILKFLDRYEKSNSGDRVKRVLDQWSPDMDDMNVMDEDEKSIEAREKVKLIVFEHVHSDLSPHPLRVLWNNYRKYAAVAAIVLVLGSAIWLSFDQSGNMTHPAFAEIHKNWQTENSERMTINLPDGSTVQINGGSSLEMDETAFNKEKREIWLSGEAFFNIARNPEKPFIVHTGSVQTTVRGTSFNVKAYTELEETVISVREGKVEVSADNQLCGILTANKQLSYDKVSGKAETADADWHEAAGWIGGQIVLNHAGAKELALRIKQYFGMEVIIEDNALEGKQISGVFAPESSIVEMLNTISAVHQIHYDIKEKKVIIIP